MWRLHICHSSDLHLIHSSSIIPPSHPRPRDSLPSLSNSSSTLCGTYFSHHFTDIHSLLDILGGEVQVSAADPLDLKPISEVVVSAAAELHLQKIDGLFLETAARHICVLVETNAIPQAHLSEETQRGGSIILCYNECCTDWLSKAHKSYHSFSLIQFLPCFLLSVPFLNVDLNFVYLVIIMFVLFGVFRRGLCILHKHIFILNKMHAHLWVYVQMSTSL